MNCKPGDLAIVIKTYDDYPEMLGKIVKLLNLSPIFPIACWNYEGKKFEYECIEGRTWVDAIPDSFLKPIDNSKGEDESLTWSKVPTNDLISV